MIVKAGGAMALLIGGLYCGGVLGGAGYSREVGRPQAEVMRALADLDVTAQPAGPDIDPSRSGGVKPLFKLEQTPNAMIWSVMSGDRVATRMIADITPIDAGRTRVTAHVERGDAPDDVVSPAFRSKGVTMGLFAVALEDELTELTAPPTDEAGCAKLMRDFQDGVYAQGLGGKPGNLSAAIAQGAKTNLRLNAIEGERRRLGCKNASANTFAAGAQQMEPADPASNLSPPAPGDVSFVPGKPMVDPSAPGTR